MEETLKYLNFTDSMIKFVLNSKKFGIVYHILDDSGSMIINDGKIIKKNKDKLYISKCSRWTEMVENTKNFANISFFGRIPMEFRFLNRSIPIKVGYPEDYYDSINIPNYYLPKNIDHNYQTLLGICNSSPNGTTPLCRHIFEITMEIRQYEHILRENSQLALIIISTDGEASDGDINEALRPLQQLPVLIILKLHTGEEKVIKYWNNIINDLEIRIVVLDDWISESKEVEKYNNWLVYGEPLHYLRQIVFSKELNILDNQELSYDNFIFICNLIYGEKIISKLMEFDHDKDEIKEEDIIENFLVSLEDYLDKNNELKIISSKSLKHEHWINIDGVKEKFLPKKYRKNKSKIFYMNFYYSFLSIFVLVLSILIFTQYSQNIQNLN